jgi:hypothetical protein
MTSLWLDPIETELKSREQQFLLLVNPIAHLQKHQIGTTAVPGEESINHDGEVKIPDSRYNFKSST